MQSVIDFGSYIASLLKGRVARILFDYNEKCGAVLTTRGNLIFLKNKYYLRVKSVQLYKSDKIKFQYLQVDRAAFVGSPDDFDAEFAEIEIDNEDGTVEIVKVEKYQDIQSKINSYFGEQKDQSEDDEDEENSEDDESDEEEENLEDDDESDEEDDELNKILEDTDESSESAESSEGEEEIKCHGDVCPIDMDKIMKSLEEQTEAINLNQEVLLKSLEQKQEQVD